MSAADRRRIREARSTVWAERHKQIVSQMQLTNGSFTNGGWLVGMGTEWMITRNWTAFID
jgi:hypothetical protein